MSFVGRYAQNPRFSPDTLPGLRLWLDAADATTVTLSGSNVTRWNDKSGNLRHGTPVNGLTYSTASNGVVFTRASSQYLSLPDNTFPIGSSSFSIFFVFTPTATSYEIQLITAGARGGSIFGIRSGNAGTGTLQTFWSGGANDLQTSNLWAVKQRNIGALLYQTSGARSLWINGVQGASETSGGTSITSSNRIGTLEPGAFNTFDGQFHEVLVFESSLSVTERQQVEAYLAQKWDPVPSPLTIPGCVFWLDAGDRSTLTLSSSNTVTAWTEKSGANRTVTTNSTGIYSATAMNGRPGIQFSAGNVMTSSTAATLGNNLTAFVVFMGTSPGPLGLNIPLFVGSSANGYQLMYRGDFQTYQASQEGAGGTGNSHYTTINLPIMMAGMVSSTTPYWSVFLNGYANINPGIGGYNTPPVSNVGATTIYIPGGNPYWGGPANGMFNGVISEVLLFSNALSTTQRQTVEGYLSSKWGIPVSVKPSVLPAAHAFPLALPALRTFSPLDIDGLAIWLDAADSTSYRLSGSNVTQFNDKQGLITLTASSAYATVGTQPGFTFASNTSTYTATTTITPAAFTTSSTDFTLAIIANHTTEGIVNALPFNIGISGPRLCPFFSYDGVAGRVSTFADCAAPADPRLGAGNSIVSGSPSVVIYRRSGSTVTLRIAGATAASNTFSSPSSFASSNYTVTMSPGGAKWWGTLFEVLHYSAALSDVDIVRLEGYLTDKWRLRSSMGGVSHPYRFGPAVVLPTQFSGSAFWLDAADANSFTLSGSNVTQWRDKSSNGFAGSGVGNPVRTTVDGYSAVTFDGTSQYIDFGDVLDLGTAPLNIFAVSQFTSGGTGGIIAKSRLGVSQNRWALFREGSTLYTFAIGDSGQGVLSYNDTNNSRRLLSWTWDRSTQTLYQNGSSIATGAYANTSATNSTNNLLVGFYNNTSGGGGGNGYYFGGSINEIVCIFGAMTTLQRQQMEGYLAWKWGLQSNLPSPTTPWLQLKRALTPVFTPTQIPGCAFWIDAADAASMTLSGSNVTQWRDKSSNGVAGTAVASPVLTTVDGVPAVTFNGTSQYIDFGTAGNLGSNQFHIFTVSKFNTTADGSILARVANGDQYYRYTMLRAGGVMYLATQADTGGYGSNASFSDTNTSRRLLSFSWDRSTIRGYQNGTVVGSGSYASTATYTSSFKLLVAGYNNSSGGTPPDSFFMNGSINEILFYFGPLTTAQRQRIEGYLAEKWGLRGSLGGLNHPSRFGPPTILPTQISGCTLWLDAADATTLTLSGSNVTAWANKSGTASLTLFGTAPTYVSNQVVFNSSGRFRGAYALTTQTTIFAVYSTSNTTTNARLIAVDATNAYGNIHAPCPLPDGSMSDFLVWTGGSYPTNNWYTTLTPQTGLRMYTVALNGVNPSVWRNGSAATMGGTSATATGNGSNISVGADLDGQGPFNGGISELILFSAALSTDQRQQVEGYLAWKWGLQQNLPTSTHPYRTFKP